MSDKKRIVIADDHPIFRSGLRDIIRSDSAYEVVGEAEDGAKALAIIRDEMPAVAILDINMPELTGFEVIKEIRKTGSKTEFVILSMHDDEKMFAKAMDLGVRGYVLKDSAAVEIINCLQAVCRGQNYTSAAVTTYLIKRASGSEAVEGLDSLTPTERKVLKKVAEYMTSREIANEFNVSLRTIENHRTNISSKLRLHGSHALIKFALKNQADL